MNASTEHSFLPRFSDARDIEEFVSTLERFERGEINAEDFRRYRLARGVYGQRQEGQQMIRVKIPQGLLAPAALEALAEVAERFGHGFGHFTTRQNVQFHFVDMHDAEEVMRICHAAGVTTREACGNTVRTVTTSPWAGIRTGGTFDTTPHGEAITRFFLRSPWANSLPRKFKIALAASAQDDVFTAINDIGLVPMLRDGQRGFRMYVAGGLSTSPQAAQVFFEFLPEADLLDACEAVVRIFDARGNRENKHRARLKYVARKLGAERFLAALREEYAAVKARGGTPLDLSVTTAPPAPPPPSAEDAARDHATRRTPQYLAWRASNVYAQDQAGYAAVVIRRALGKVTAEEFRALARLCVGFADGSARTTVDQNVMLRYVPLARLPALFEALDAAGLARPGAGTVADVTTCPGAESCNLAVTASRQVGEAIAARVEGDVALAPALELARTATIKVSGCPNSCGQHHVADIGFHGAAKRVGERTAPVYQLHLGGGVDDRGARFGRQVIKVPARRVPEAVARLVALYARERAGDESPATFYERVDEARVVSALEDLAAMDASTPDETFLDIGETQGFRIAIGEGECAA
jgi:sulfite reductase (NADPH) hemoprotein beta-component